MLEEAVLDLLKTRLMQPEAVAAFIKDYAEVSNEKVLIFIQNCAV